MNQLSVAIAVSTAGLPEEIRTNLSDLPVRIAIERQKVEDLESFLKRLQEVRPDVVILEPASASADRLEKLIIQIKALESAPEIIAVDMEPDPDLIDAVTRAGAAAYLFPPLANRLPQAVQRLARREVGEKAAPHAGGRTIGLLSVKGGCGATTIGCHLACELQRQTVQRILLADLDMSSGIMRFLMRSKSTYSVLDAAKNVHRLDMSFWKALVSNGSPRLELISAPGPTAAELPDVGSFQQVLQFTRAHYEWILTDLGHGLNALSMGLIEEMDQCFVVTTLDVPALYQAKQILQTLRESGYGHNRLHVVVNRMAKNPELMLDELRHMLGRSPYAVLPDEHAGLYEAYAEGGLLPSTSPLRMRIAALAAKLAGLPEPQKSKGKFWFLN